MERVTHNIV